MSAAPFCSHFVLPDSPDYCRLVPHYVLPSKLEQAKALVATGQMCGHGFRQDMLQWASASIDPDTKEVYLSVPHTGFCYHHPITHLANVSS